MIIEITQSPHVFIVFLTASMGISYAFFNRQGFGFSKILVLIFIGFPSILFAYEHNHIVDMGLGAFIGFLHAKGMIGALNPLEWFSRLFDRFRWNFQSKKHAHAEARAHANNNQQNHDFREQEARKRQEQARKDREQAKRKHAGSKQKQGSDENSNHSNQSQQKKSSNSGYDQYKQNYQKPKPRLKTEREKAFEVLGLEPTATMEEAKRARKKLMSLYHPDKLAGLPEGRRKQAEEEAKQINLAWAKLSEK